MSARAPAVLLLSLLALAAAGCGDGEAVEPAPETPAETVAAGPAALEGDGDAGGDLFYQVGCADCHVRSASGPVAGLGPNLDETEPSKELVIDRVVNGFGEMPSFRDRLTDQQIADIAAYVAETH